MIGGILDNPTLLRSEQGRYMGTDQSWYEVVAECQSAVQRLRAVLTCGGEVTPELQVDLDFVTIAMRNYLYGRAHKLASQGEDAVEDAFLAMLVQFHRDLRSPTFSSMERKFGSYVSTNAKRMLFERLNSVQKQPLSIHESLDALVGKEGFNRYEVIEDPSMEQLVEDYHEEQLRARLAAAIKTLPVLDQHVITMILEGIPKVEIARTLNMSAPNVTHISKRVEAQLRRVLNAEEA